jgi:hypothetical protein
MDTSRAAVVDENENLPSLTAETTLRIMVPFGVTV